MSAMADAWICLNAVNEIIGGPASSPLDAQVAALTINRRFLQATRLLDEIVLGDIARAFQWRTVRHSEWRAETQVLAEMAISS